MNVFAFIISYLSLFYKSSGQLFNLLSYLFFRVSIDFFLILCYNIIVLFYAVVSKWS